MLNIAAMKRFLKITVIIFLSACLMAIIQSCKKSPEVPTLTTVTVSGITQTSAVSGGDVTDNGGTEVTSRGVCWNTSDNPTIANDTTSDGTGAGSFKSSLTQLTPNTKYYVRAYATNSEGTGYGKNVSFTTLGMSPIIFNSDLTYSSVSDLDGNIYKTIQIGAQIWMAENLRTTKYNNGESIPEVTDMIVWTNLSSGAYCNYANSEYNDSISIFGRLYKTRVK